MLRATAMTAKPIWRERLEALVRGLTGRCGPAVAAGAGIVLPCSAWPPRVALRGSTAWAVEVFSERALDSKLGDQRQYDEESQYLAADTRRSRPSRLGGAQISSAPIKPRRSAW
jgi:hypothetical protein